MIVVVLAVQAAAILALALLWQAQPDWQDAIFYTVAIGLPAIPLVLAAVLHERRLRRP